MSITFYKKNITDENYTGIGVSNFHLKVEQDEENF